MDVSERIPIERLKALQNITYEMFKKATPKCKSDKERKEYFEKIKGYTNNLIKQKGVAIRNYHYVESYPSGTTSRLYCGASIQGIACDIRGFLFRDITTDFDFTNCHPVLLEHICKKHNIDCPILKEYNLNRKIYLERIGDGAKEIFLKSVNSDSVNKKCSDPFFKSFDKELKVIQKKLYLIDDYQYIIKTIPVDRSYNCLGSCINRILCMYENECLQLLTRSLVSKNIEIASLMFDGCMVYGNHYNNDIIPELNEIMSHYGLKVQTKPHSTLFNLEDFPTSSEDSDEEVTDTDATIQLIANYPYWVFCDGSLYVYDETTGMWSDNSNIHRKFIIKYADGVHSCKYNYINHVLNLLPSLCPIDNDWLKKNANTSLGMLLFNNGIYNGVLIPFNYKIVFFYKINIDYVPLNQEELVSCKDIAKRFFYDPLGIPVGNYLIHYISRGLMGECDKAIMMALGETGTGKSFLTSAILNSIEGYGGAFSANNLLYSNSTADEASQYRWIKLLAFKRFIISNELDINKKLNGNMMKKLSSGGEDLITARNHGGNETSFKLHFSGMILANDLSPILPYDTAIDSRLKVITFSKVYTENPTEFELKQDMNVKHEITTPIFKRLFLMMLLNNYKENIKEPPEVRNFKKDWITEEPDTIKAILQDYDLTDNEDDCLFSASIFEWCAGKNIDVRKFGRDIKKYNLQNKTNIHSKQKMINGKRDTIWCGIKEKA